MNRCADMMNRPHRLLPLIGLTLLACLAWLYAPALHFDYVWDDLTLFVDNPDFRSGSIEWSKLSQPVMTGTTYFRPLVLLTFMVEFAVIGTSSLISHAISYGLYLLNVTLVSVLGLMHFRRRGLPGAEIRALIAAFIYGLHPALVESTAWISGRFDLMATTFVLAALAADLQIRSPWLRAAVIATCFGFALGSKEIAAALPVLLLVQRLSLERADNSLRQILLLLRQNVATVVLCGLVGLAYLLLRFDAMGRFIHVESALATQLDRPGAHPAFVLQTLFFYVQETFMPFFGTSVPIHPVDAHKVFVPARLINAAAGALIFAAILLGASRRTYPALMLLCALACLAPVLHIVPLTISPSIGCERFLTLPLAFCVLALGSIRVSLPGTRPAVGSTLAVAVLGTWSVMAAAHVSATIPLWKNDLTLWGWVHGIHPTSAEARFNYTSAALRTGRYDLAKEVFAAQLREGPLEASQQMNYGFLLAKTGEPEEAMRYIEGALSVFPKIKPDGDVRSFRSPIEGYVRSRVGFGYYALAEAKLAARDFSGALIAVDEALRYRPVTPQIVLAKSLALSALRRHTEAAQVFERALSLTHPSRQTFLLIRRNEFLKSVQTMDNGVHPAAAQLKDAG